MLKAPTGNYSKSVICNKTKMFWNLIDAINRGPTNQKLNFESYVPLGSAPLNHPAINGETSSPSHMDGGVVIVRTRTEWRGKLKRKTKSKWRRKTHRSSSFGEAGSETPFDKAAPMKKQADIPTYYCWTEHDRSEAPEILRKKWHFSSSLANAWCFQIKIGGW